MTNPKPIDITGHFKIKKKDTNHIALVKLFLNDPEGVMWGVRAIKILTEYRKRVIHVSQMHRLLTKMLERGLVEDFGDCTCETYRISPKGKSFTKNMHIRVFKADKVKLVEEL